MLQGNKMRAALVNINENTSAVAIKGESPKRLDASLKSINRAFPQVGAMQHKRLDQRQEQGQ
jgi:hypothetical protein